MNDNLISRQEAVKSLEEWESKYTWDSWAYNHKDDLTCHIESPSSVIKELSSVEPESAQWVQMLINPNMYICSNCRVAWNKRLVFDNDGYSENIFMKYCPCCGRKMQTKIDYE